MMLFTKEIEAKLRANARAQDEKDGHDFFPVVKLFTPDAGATWLLTELRGEGAEEIAFGLCDLGLGSPELGYVSMAELRQVRGRLRLPVERDFLFKAEGPLSHYVRAAERKGGITEDLG